MAGRFSGQLTSSSVVAASTGRDSAAAGLVYTSYFDTDTNDEGCVYPHPWRGTLDTEGRIRPLRGIYRETSATAEFLGAEAGLPVFEFDGWRPYRAGWKDAWEAAGRPSLGGPAVAEAFGARWYQACDGDREVVVTELNPKRAVGV